MVWTAGESPLYKCVEKYNNTPREERETDRQPNRDPEQDCACTEKPNREPEEDCRREKPEFAPPPPKPRESSAPGNLLQKLTSDRDCLLILALIVLLLHEKADMKLIAALAFIILT